LKTTFIALLALAVVLAVVILPVVYGQSSVEQGITDSPRVFSIGAETGYVYQYGKATVAIVVVNPNVLFSYRNIYVVLVSNWSGSLQRLFMDLHVQASLSVADMRGGLDALRERLEAKGLSDVDLRVERIEYVMNLSGKPVDKVAEAVGEVFGGLDETILVVDERLFDLLQLYLHTGISSLPREVPDPSNGLWRSLNEAADSLVRDLANSSCFCYMDVLGDGISVDGLPNPIFLEIGVQPPYEKCLAIIERHVVELADSIRKYMPEDIPLYIDLYEGPYCPFKFEPVPPVIVGIWRVDNASTPKLDGGQGDLVLEPQGGYSLLYIAITALIPVLGVTTYLVVERLRK
jgi:hypothetical protein